MMVCRTNGWDYVDVLAIYWLDYQSNSMGLSASDRSKGLAWPSKDAELTKSNSGSLASDNSNATWGRRDMRRVHVLHSNGSLVFFGAPVEEPNETGLAIPLLQNFWRSTCYSRKMNFAIQEWGVTVTSNNER